MIEIETWRDPFDAGFSTCRPRKIQLNPGLTVLVGCNGAGKTTLLKNIKEYAKKQNWPTYNHDNLHDDISKNSQSLMNDIDLFSFLFSASEGETIRENIRVICKNIKEFLEEGETPESKERKQWRSYFGDDLEEDNSVSTDVRLLLLDAVDSGYSIDNIVELKEIIEEVIKDSTSLGKDLYVIVAANEYELARGEQCFDVNTGKYLTFKDYEDFRKFILKSKEKKIKRIEKVV